MCWKREPYEIFVGSDVRSVQPAGSYEEKFRVLEELQEAYAPVEAFAMKAVQQPDGTYTATEGFRCGLWILRYAKNLPAELEITGDKGYKLVDVLDGKVSLDEFTAQISREDLIAMFRGEGMCSPKVTAGTAAAFGGIQIPCRHWEFRQAAVQTDLPVFEWTVGTKAFSLPNGTLLGCTFNTELVGALYEMTGKSFVSTRLILFLDQA